MLTEKTLVVSTGNVRESTAVWLRRQAGRSDTPDLIVFRKDEVGWWVAVPTRQQLDVLISWHEETGRGAIPPELIGLIWVAIEHGCEWIMLDRDADGSDLPAWDW